MSVEFMTKVYAALAQLTNASRLYELRLPKSVDTAAGCLLVEAFLADDGLQELASREVIVLSTSASIELRSLLGQPAAFLASLANGSRTAFHGYVSHAAMLGSEAALRATACACRPGCGWPPRAAIAASGRKGGGRYRRQRVFRFRPLSAIVVGEDSQDQPQGGNEIQCDQLGRVRIRYHWQDSADATCWVRVAQRSAGGGMGSQFLPRIGQEVLVQFIENDIDRPIIVGALYNGQGESGIAPTPGGTTAQEATDHFGQAHDHATSAQGNLVGGHGPVWHGSGGGSGAHRNSSAMWGVRSKEFGGSGYNQLVFDDTDSQGRVQLRTTLAATELNLGHLIHNTDNYRGSLRGQGAELRTDAYGTVRAGAGLLVTSYKITHGASQREPAGDNTAGIAMLKQAVKLGETFSDIAVKHGTVGLASHMGSHKANASALDEKEAPLKSLLTAVSGMVGDAGVDDAQADAGERKTGPGAGKLPHSADPIIAISAKDGLSMSAARDLQMATGETATVMSGADTQIATGGQMRIHTQQAIGMLGGAVKPGEQDIGVQVIAARDPIDVQAQAGAILVQARDVINVKSSNAHIDWAAAKKISLSTVGGANITIDGGNITVQCPGKIEIKAGKKSFVGPAKEVYDLPAMPRSICVECLKKSLASGAAFTMVE